MAEESSFDHLEHHDGDLKNILKTYVTFAPSFLVRWAEEVEINGKIQFSSRLNKKYFRLILYMPVFMGGRSKLAAGKQFMLKGLLCGAFSICRLDGGEHTEVFI